MRNEQWTQTNEFSRNFLSGWWKLRQKHLKCFCKCTEMTLSRAHVFFLFFFVLFCFVLFFLTSKIGLKKWKMTPCLSLIDLTKLFSVFLFLRSIYREIIITAIKWVGFFGDHMSDFSFLSMTNFIALSSLHLEFVYSSPPIFFETPATGNLQLNQSSWPIACSQDFPKDGHEVVFFF